MRRFWIGSIATLIAVSAQAVPVTVGGVSWRQVKDTLGFSWNQVATVCDSTTGICNGSLGSVDFTGWTWASQAEVVALLEELIMPGSTQFPTLTTIYNSAGSADIDSAIDASKFLPTFQDLVFIPREAVIGFTRTSDVNGNAYWGEMWDIIDPMAVDQARVAFAGLKTSVYAGTGFWLYQSVAVPEPGTLGLLGLGLAGIGIARRRKTS